MLCYVCILTHHHHSEYESQNMMHIAHSNDVAKINSKHCSAICIVRTSVRCGKSLTLMLQQRRARKPTNTIYPI